MGLFPLYQLKPLNSHPDIFMSGTPQDLSTHWEKCRKRGIPLEVAIVVGTVPAVSYAATQKVPPEVDELALAGGLMGEPVKLIKCQTIDVEVPATAEIVLEGIIPTNYMTWNWKPTGCFYKFCGTKLGSRAPRKVAASAFAALAV